MPPPRRIQVEGVEAPALGTAPSRTDVFGGPGGAGSQLSKVAQALSQFSPTLSRFAQQEAEQEEQEAQQRGRAAAFRENAEDFRKRVRSGEIPEWENPWFRLGFQEVQARKLADTYAADLTARMQQVLDEEGATDAGEFDRLVSETKEAFLEENIPEGASSFLTSTFANQAQALEGGLRRQFASQAGANMVEQTLDGLYGQTVSTLQSDISREEKLQSIQNEVDRLYQVGMDPGDIHDTAATAIVQEALRTSNDSLLTYLTDIQTGTGNLSGRPEMGAMIAQARRQIRSDKAAARAERWDEFQSARNNAKIDLQQGVVDALQEAGEEGERLTVTDFDNLRTQAVLAGVENADDMVRETVEAWYSTDDVSEDTVRLTTDTIWDPSRIESGNYVDRQDILHLLRTRQVNQGGYNYLVNELQQRNAAYSLPGEGNAAARNAIRDPDFSFLMSGFSTTYQQFIQMIGQPGKGHLVNQARSRIHRAWTQAYAEGAGAMDSAQKGRLISAIIGQEVEKMYDQGLALGGGEDPRPEQYWMEFGREIPQPVWEEFLAWSDTGGEVSVQLARTLIQAGIPPGSVEPETIRNFRTTVMQSRAESPFQR